MEKSINFLIPRGSDFNPHISASPYLVRNRLLHGLFKHINKLNGRLLDFGCGAKPYQNIINVREYIGLDFPSEGHDHSNELIDVFYDGKNIPFENNFFDSIFSSEVFEHVFNLEEVLLELFRVLKPGGIILVTCPFAIGEHEQPNDFARYTSFALNHIMTRGGFEVIHYEKLGGSIDAIVQLRLNYFQKNIMPYFEKVPVLRSLLRKGTNTCMNIYANIVGKLLPKSDDLYLNNLIICRKPVC
jgi:SAM-dependent methyltransferase